MENHYDLAEGIARNQLIDLMEQTRYKVEQRVTHYNDNIKALNQREKELKSTIDQFRFKLADDDSNVLQELLREHSEVKAKLLSYLEMDTTSFMTQEELLEVVETAKRHQEACRELQDEVMRQRDEVRAKIEDLQQEYKRLAHYQINTDTWELWQLCEDSFKRYYPEYIHPFLEGVVKNKFNDAVAGRITLREGE